MPRKHKNVDTAAMAYDYTYNGYSLRDLEDKYGLSKTAIYARFEKARIPMRHNRRDARKKARESLNKREMNNWS